MNLCFALLDEPVIKGRGEEPALGELSFARLLEDVAAVGGVLRAVEVAAQTPVAVPIGDDRRWCVAALAVARIGGWVVSGETAVRFAPDGTLHWDGNHLDWPGVLRAGRTDPAAVVEVEPTASYDGSRPLTAMIERVTGLNFPVEAADLRAVLA